MSESETKLTLAEVITSTTEEKKPEPASVPPTTETSEPKKEETIVEQKAESEPKKEEKSVIKLEDDKDHFICNNCYLKHFKKIDLDSDEENNTKEDNNEDKEEDRDDNEIKVIKDEQKIKCSICKRWHHYIGNVEGCGCILF